MSMELVHVADGGSGGSTSTLQASISGISRKNFDIYKSSNTSPLSSVSLGSNTVTVTVTNKSSSTIYLFEINVNCNNVNLGNVGYSAIGTITSSTSGWKLTGRALAPNASVSYTVTKTGNTTSFTSAGYPDINVVMWYSSSATINFGRGTYSHTSMSSKTYSPTYFNIYNPVVKDIVKSGSYQTSFYKNGSFSNSGMTVTANYYYHESTSTFSHSSDVTSSCSFTGYDMSTVGAQTVTIRYSWSIDPITYTIYVYGVTSVTENSKTNYKLGVETEISDPTSVTFTYGNGHTETVTKSNSSFAWGTYDFSSKGDKSVDFTAYDAVTQETISGTSTKKVCECGSISVNSTGATTTFITNGDFSSSGIAVTADFGDAGTSDVTSSATVTDPDMTSVGTKNVTVSYAGKSTTYEITIDGMTDARIYLEGSYEKDGVTTIKFLKGSDGTLMTSGLQVFYSRSDTNPAEAEILKANWDSTTAHTPSVSVDTSEVNPIKNGLYTVSVSVTFEGNTITKTYQIEVYSLESISLSDQKTEFIHTGSNPTFSTGSLSVTAHFSDGSERVLDSSEYSVSAPDNMDVGSHEVSISATIGATATASYNIDVIPDYPIEIVEVDISAWNDTFIADQTFSKSNIIVYAKMRGGNARKSVDFTTSLDGNVFGTDITDATTTFTITVETNDPNNPLTVAYNDEVIKDSATLTAKYDRLTGISVSANSTAAWQSTSALKYVRAGDKFTDYINDNCYLVVTASYEYSADKQLSRGQYDIGVYDNGTKVKALGENWTKDDMGENTITVSYGGKVATYTVKVSKLLSIVVTNNTKTLYNRYQSFDPNTLTVVRKYTLDGENAEAGNMSLDVNDITFSGCTDKLVPDNNDELTTDIGLSYTEAGVTKTTSVTITVKRLVSVTLDVAKIPVNYGEPLVLVGHYLTVLFNTDEEATAYQITSGNVITIDSVVYPIAISLDSLIIKNKAENTTIGLTFGEETVYATFDVHCIYLDHISADYSYYSGQTLYAGDKVYRSNLVIKKYIYTTDGNTNISGSPETISSSSDGLTFSASDEYPLAAGSNSFDISYEQGIGNTLQTKSVTFTLTAIQIKLVSISADKDTLTRNLNSYVEGQNLSLAGLEVLAVFNRTASNRQIDLTDYDLKIRIGDGEPLPTKSPTLSTSDNNKKLYVIWSYDGTTKEYEVGTLTVAAKTLTGIAVNTNSTHKTAYFIGDKLSTSGLILDLTFNDDSNGTALSGFITSEDTHLTTPFSSAGNVIVTVYYTDPDSNATATCSYSITVSVPQLESLRFDTSLLVLRVTNDNPYTFDGLVVYGIFENNYEERLTLDDDSTLAVGEWEITTDLDRDSSNNVHYTSSNLGIKEVIITAKNPYDSTDTITGTLRITVEPNKELKEIKYRFDSSVEEPSTYRVGDIFDGKGLIVEALFKDEGWMPVEGWTTSNPALGTLLRSGGRYTVKIEYESQGVVKSIDYTITVLMPYDSGLVEENTYKVAFNVSSVDHEEATIEFSPDTQLPLFNANVITEDDNNESPTYGLNKYVGSNANADCIGYIKLGATSDVDGSVIENGQVILFDDPVNPIDGQGNIIVKFPHYIQGYADRINNCHFGVIYNKRFFVSGNPEYPNIDWHSSQVNSAQVEHYDTEEDLDLTYFSDLDYCKYGSENSTIKGYDIYRDGTLLVFKGKSQHEATIYTRTTSLVNASSYDGKVVSEGELAEDAYPCFAVNPNGGTGAISNYSIINFVGETLVLTKEGLKAITSKETTYNNAKYSYDVSSHINNKLLKNNNLDNVSIAQFKEKLLLKTDEGLYVGEYKLRDANSEYEWYFCDNIDAYYFFEIDDELYFSDEEGNINRFVDNDSINVKDKPRTYIGLAGTTLSIDANTDVIVVSKTYANEIQDGKEFHLLSQISSITGDYTDESQIYATLGNFINKYTRENALREGIVSFDQTAYIGLIDPDNNELIIKPYTAQGDVDYSRMNEAKNFFNNERNIYIDNIVGTVYDVAVDIKYHLKRVDSVTPGDYRYQIVDEDDLVVDLLGIESFRLSFRVNELEIAYVINVAPNGTDGAKQFNVGVPMKREGNNGEQYIPLDLIYYNGRSTGTYRGVITNHKNVISYFVTKPFNLGHDLYQKTIFMWSIINDTQIASCMNVGYISSRKADDFKIAVREVGGARQLEYSNEFDYAKLHFTNDKLPHVYNRSRLLARVGFIRFIFSNDEGTRMILSKLEIIYAYSLLMKGVR